MTNPYHTQIQDIISNIYFPDKSSVRERASDIVIKGDNLGFSLDISNLELKEAESVRNETIKQLQSIKNVGKISIVLTDSQPRSNSNKSEKAKLYVDNVGKIILVASGKGGVGKSTITALLAHKLSSEGKKVGIIDADIYGPSIPNIFNLEGKPDLINNRMIPLKNYGIYVNSIGFLTDPSSSMSWRGPMASKALYQLLSLTNWGQLDYLIVDTPPGTGDIHLSLLQNYIIDKVLMVTTPQQISAIDVMRAINLYNKFGVSIAGIIENMSYYTDPDTGKKINLFSGKGGSFIAKKHNIPFLGELPINPELSRACDAGEELKKYSALLDKLSI